MGKKFDLRVTICVHGKARTLFSVKDPPSGEMLVSRKRPDSLRPFGLNPQNIPAIRGMLPRIKEQRYSIHPSHESPDANLLKSTTTIAGGKTYHYYHLTKAIKGGLRYAPLFVQRCPRLEGENYNASTPGAHEISLGS